MSTRIRSPFRFPPPDVFLKSLARRLAEDSGVDPDSREFAAELRGVSLANEDETPFDMLFKDLHAMQVRVLFYGYIL